MALVAATVLMNNQIQAYMDESALAIYGVLLTVSALFSHMFMGIGQAASPILSANLGAAKPKNSGSTAIYDDNNWNLFHSVLCMRLVLPG